jgi:gamma-glutamylputrescine oxidase
MSGPKLPYTYLETSIWVQPPADLRPELNEHIQADVAIIGGGYTGLNAALALKDSGVDVVLLDMDFCGKGASGRNQGHLTPTIGKDLPTLVKYVGKERAGEFAKFADRAVRFTETTFKKYAIDCDYRAVGNIIAGMHLKHRAPLERVAELAGSLGMGVTFLSEDDMQRRRLPGVFRFGILEHCGGHLHPGKYVSALRQTAIKAGVRIYEGTRVDGIEESLSPVIIRTTKGSVRADKVVVATNAYTPTTLKFLKSRLVALRVTLFQTKKLTDAQRQAVGWDGGEGIYTAHESLESYRPSPDGRIIGGSKFVQYGYGGALVPGYQPKVFDQWGELLRERFAELPGLEIDTFWGGWIGMTLDFLPFSFANPSGNVFFGMGYNGHGIAQATLNGSMLADQVLGRPNENVELLKRRVFPLPPEPLRWLTVQGLKWYYDRLDKAIDADLRLRRV